MGSVIRELRYTVRSLLRSPAFTSVAVLTLAIGIGANTAVFSVISAVIMSPLPYDAPEELVVVGGQLSGIGSQDLTASPAEFRDYGERSRTLEGIAASWILNVNVTGIDQPFRGQTAVVTPNFLPLLGVDPMLGRGLTQEDTGGDIGHVSILSYAAWQRFYGGDSTIVGRVILIDDDPIEIVGVMPEGFEHPGDLQGGSVDMWAPIDLSVDSRFGQGRNNRNYTLYGRLQGGTDIRASKAEFLAISADLREEYPASYPIEAGWSAQVVPLLDRVVGSAKYSLWVIFGAVGFVLLVACTNVANLLLARGSTKAREIAIRSALGGSRSVIGRRFVLESLVLGVVGGALGLLLAYAGTGIIRNGVAAFVPRVEGAHMSVSVLLFTLVAALTTSLVFGLIPAVQLSRINLQDLLKDGAGGSGVARGAHRLRNGLVIAEVAMSIVLLVGSGLLLKSFNRLMDVEPGFDPDPVMTMRTYLPWTITPQDGRYFELPVRVQFFGEAIRRIAELPGVESVAVTSNLPLRRLNGAPFVVEGSEQEGTNRAINAEVRQVSPSYFEAMSVPLIRGRVLAQSDEVDTPGVVVVNQAWVARYSPDEVAVGRRIRIGNNPQAPWNEIVGVVGNVSQHGLDVRPRETMYASYRQGVSIDMTFVIKTAGAPERITERAIAAIHSLDPTLPVFLPETMNDVVAGTVAERRLVMVLLLLFAAQATVLAAIGIYGVISQSVTQRLREIGIRLALGAERSTVMGLVFRDGMRLAAMGVLIGAGIAAAASRVLSSLLFSVGRFDLVVFGSVAAMALAVAALATLIPALRATGVDPLLTMKAD